MYIKGKIHIRIIDNVFHYNFDNSNFKAYSFTPQNSDRASDVAMINKE